MLDNRYLQDDTLEKGYYNEGIIGSKELVIASAVAIGGSILGYKKGLFKDGIKSTLEYISKHKPKLTETFNDVRKWINSDYGTPERSVFRMGVKGTFKDFYKNRSVEGAKEVINATKEDIGLFLERWNESIDRLTKDASKYSVKNSTHNTDLLKSIKSVDEAVGAYSDEMMFAKNTLKSKGYSEVIKKYFQSAEDAEKLIKRTGYRKVEIEDLFDIIINEKGKVELVEKTKFTFSANDKLGNKSAKARIEDLLNSSVISESGVIRKGIDNRNPLKLHQKYKDSFRHMIVDDSLLIDEAGKIIDLRNQKKSFQEFARNLATDWNIPIVGFNPLRMLGVDKIGKEKVFMGSISEDMVAPFLTGVRGNSSKNTIRNLKDKVDVLKGVRENVTIINGDVYRISDDNRGIVKMNYKKKKELISIPKHMDKGTYSLTPTENALRKMGGLSTRTFEDYTPADGWKYYTQKVAKFFDVGYQESERVKDAFNGMDEYSSVDSYIEKLISKFRPKPYKDSKVTKSFSNISTPEYSGNPRDSFFVINSKTTLKDVASNKFNKETIKDYMYQYVADFDNDYESVNKNTGKLFFMLERMNQTISTVGLGLSLNSTKSSWDVGKNLLLKRFLPVYGAYHGYQLINTIGEDDTENGTKPSTLHQRILSSVAKVDIGLHAITEKTGLPKLVKNLSQLTPGSDMLEELPMISSFNLGDTAEERAEYWKNGYDPVRKGRFWELNETPFIGGQIQYYKPNALRSAMADAKFSDSLYGSRKEYYSQILNQKYYDKKNYYDRPYLMSSSGFENVPLIGPVLSSTIGRIVSPPRKMHLEYWTEDKSRPKTNYEINQMEEQNVINLSHIKSLNVDNANRRSKIQEMFNRDKLSLINIFKKNSSSSNNSYGVSGELIDNESNMFAAYKAPGGSIGLLKYEDNPVNAMYKINRRGYTPGKVTGVMDRASLINDYIINDDIIKNEESLNASSPYNFSNTFKSQFRNTANVAGIYGFAVTGFVTGNLGAGDTLIETSGYSRSFNRAFWDQELGGFGKDLSEIFRRFVQNRRKDVNYYNPVRNTMPDWLPGEDGFIDFQHGDPYTKIARGEERLPGEGYERLHGIDMDELLELKIGSSSIGKTKDEIVKHFLHQDEITDKELLGIVNKGTREHERIEKLLLKSGVAIDSEVQIKDEKNGVVGTYDVRLHDPSSKTGEAIMDIKTINAKGFEKVKKTNTPKDVNQRQVNWYLHHTNKNNKGYIMYVNRDNPNETHTIGFNYSKKMYDSTMATLESARNEVRTMLENRQISRADLYKPIDKYRILADTAPYSDEFREMNQMMSAMQLSEEEEIELRNIRNRVANVKKKSRFYEYRFKHSGIEKERVKIKSAINATTYNIKGSDTPIKLSGVKINKSHPKYKEAIEFLNKNLSSGENVTIGISKDLSRRNNNDMYNSTKAVVYSNGMNINKELIKRGLAEEVENDFSPTGIRARFNALEIGFGKAWENIAHFDSLANTKLLQVRTAAEDYERKQVYGKDFKSWENPIKDFVKPSMWKNMNRNPLYGIAMGATVGYMFGGKNSKYGKLMGTIAGAAVVGLGQIYKAGHEAITGERWIPKEKERERELNDYLDKIKFVKNRRLFEVYAEKSMREDGIDVKEVIASNKKTGNFLKGKKRRIQKAKKNARMTGDANYKDFKDADVDVKMIDKLPTFIRGIVTGDLKNAKENKTNSLIKSANKEINEIANNRKSFTLSDNALKAIEYYNESEKTMYGYDPGEQLTNIMAAMPKKDKEYFKHFLEAPEHERKKILEIAPKYMRRALQNSYGMKVDDKENLADYFSKHYLPGEDWDGWQENFNLDAMKVKMVQKQGLDFGQFNIWEDDKKEADMYGEVAIPNMNYKTKNVEVVKRKLKKILGTSGYENIDLSFKFGKSTSTINLDLYEDRKEKYEKKLKERLGIY